MFLKKKKHTHTRKNKNKLSVDLNLKKNVHKQGVGLGRVVRKVRQHPDDHEFES
jgi:hypothetical protein